jgi:hypothetical protein
MLQHQWTAPIRTQVFEKIHDLLKVYPGYKIVFTGHSLGAAVATLVVTDFRASYPNLARRTELYSYASPRGFNQPMAEWAQTLPGRNYRVTHYKDLVVRLPAMHAFTFDSTTREHIGPEFYIKPAPLSAESPASIIPLGANREGIPITLRPPFVESPYSFTALWNRKPWVNNLESAWGAGNHSDLGAGSVQLHANYFTFVSSAACLKRSNSDSSYVSDDSGTGQNYGSQEDTGADQITPGREPEDSDTSESSDQADAEADEAQRAQDEADDEKQKAQDAADDAAEQNSDNNDDEETRTPVSDPWGQQNSATQRKPHRNGDGLIPLSKA